MALNNAIVRNKTIIQEILSADPQFILDKVREKELITGREYTKLKSNKGDAEDLVIKLVDKLINKGRQSEFIGLLQDEKVLETYPKLEYVEWGDSGSTASSSSLSIGHGDNKTVVEPWKKTRGNGGRKRNRSESEEEVTNKKPCTVDGSGSNGETRSAGQTLTDKELMKVVKTLGQEWEQVAIHLELKTKDLDTIKAEHRSVVMQKLKILVLWRDQRPPGKATAQDLLEGLEDLEDLPVETSQLLSAQKVVKTLGQEWEKAALQLELKTKDLEVIKAEHRSVAMQKQNMLLLWKRRRPPGKATAQDLLRGLKDLEDLPVETRQLLSGQNLSDKQLLEVAQTLGQKWEQAALRLGLKNKDLEDIKAEHRSVVMQKLKMLLLWKRRRPPGEATALDLLEGLEDLKDLPDNTPLSLSGELQRIRSEFVQRVPIRLIIGLLDDLWQQHVFSTEEKEYMMDYRTRADMARCLIDMVMAKGERTSQMMIDCMKKRDPDLCSTLGLISSPACVGELQRIHSGFVKTVKISVIRGLLDDLLQQKVFSTEDKDSVMEKGKIKTDKARCLIDMVIRKGKKASRIMIESMKKRDPDLCSTLGLISSPAGVGQISDKTVVKPRTQNKGELQRIHSEFVKTVKISVIRGLLDDLLQQKVFSTEDKDSVMEKGKIKTDKARCLIDMVIRKGEKASRIMIESMKKRDPDLCSTLGLISSPAGVGQISDKTVVKPRTQNKGELQRIHSEFVKTVKIIVIRGLLGDLWQQKVFSTEDKDSVMEKGKIKTDMARCLIDMVIRKGEKASRIMIDRMKRRDPDLCSTLGLISSPAGVARDNKTRSAGRNLSNKQLRKVAEMLGQEWEQAAIHLELSITDLDCIQAGRQTDVAMQKYMMLERWKRQRPPGEATAQDLLRGLEDLEDLPFEARLLLTDYWSGEELPNLLERFLNQFQRSNENESHMHAVSSSENNPPESAPQLPQATEEDEEDTPYPMKAQPKGYCLIVNNFDFSGSSRNLGQRMGTDIDEKSLRRVFTWLGFQVEVLRDATRDQMLSSMRELASRDHSWMDCVACVVLSHGLEGGVYGVDGGVVRLKELTDVLNGVRCASLRGKPKLFFIQACQGNQNEQAVPVLDNRPARPEVSDQTDGPSSTGDHTQTDGPSSTGDLWSDAVEASEWVPTTADFLTCTATTPSYTSIRVVGQGSWFIQSLCQKLVKLVQVGSRGQDLASILTTVHNDVSKKYNRNDGRRQISQHQTTLRTRLVFPVPQDPPPRLPPSP
ncbi:unnamed protein product [Gadus morhua 'NCC']